MNRLPDATESPHAAFLRAIQEWVWSRFPTRQLSASDIFYSLQWAESQIPASVFIKSFDLFLQAHPHHFDEGCKLSKLQYEASRIIGEQQKATAQSPQKKEIQIVCDPYETALKYITICGQRTDNPILRDELRKLYASFKSAKTQAEQKYTNWNKQTEAFYKYKAEAFLLWQESVQHLCAYCLSLLSDVEQEKIKALTPAEKMHCFQLGPEAESIYVDRILREKVARYFDFEELLNSI